MELHVYEEQVEGEPTELIRRTLRGDEHAYREIVETYEQLAFRTAFVITGSAQDAEEAVQDAFVKAHRALRRFDLARPFRPWLLTIVANEARNRRRSVESRSALPLDNDFDPPAPEVDSFASVRRRELGEAIARLSPADRDAIACRFLLELSEAETAAVLGVRRGTVKSRLSRALDRLRMELSDA
jgi:RNA polymerase sigma-70 factor (ECF subfamily)